MEFRILGPLEVLEGTDALDVPGQRQRSLLALLLLHANQVVSSSRLIEELWPDEASDSHAGALQASVSRLRKSLGSGAELLVTLPTGYSISRLDETTWFAWSRSSASRPRCLCPATSRGRSSSSTSSGPRIRNSIRPPGRVCRLSVACKRPIAFSLPDRPHRAVAERKGVR